MAKVVDLNINPDIEDLMLASVKTKNRYYSNSIIDRKIAVGGRQYEKLESQSHMKKLGLMWQGLTQEKRDEWSSVAENCDLTGWQLFLQDVSFRLRANLPGFPILSQFRQYKGLVAYVPPDCSDFYIAQPHYVNYSVSIKNVGQKNARTWTEIEETMTAPFLIEFNYSSGFEPTGTGNLFFVEVSFYGTKSGAPAGDSFQFPLTQISDWNTFSEEITPDLDTITTYEVGIFGEEITGFLLLDNFNFYHDSQNWAYDPFCNHFDEYYYYILSSYVQSWQWDISGTGEFFENVYIE